MTKRHNAKYKIDRRLGVILWGRPKSPFNRRNSKPGQHGVQGQRKSYKLYGESLKNSSNKPNIRYIKFDIILEITIYASY